MHDVLFPSPIGQSGAGAQLSVCCQYNFCSRRLSVPSQHVTMSTSCTLQASAGKDGFRGSLSCAKRTDPLRAPKVFSVYIIREQQDGASDPALISSLRSPGLLLPVISTVPLSDPRLVFKMLLPFNAAIAAILGTLAVVSAAPASDSLSPRQTKVTLQRGYAWATDSRWAKNILKVKGAMPTWYWHWQDGPLTEFQG